MGSFREMLNDLETREDVDTDTSYLDAYRRTGDLTSLERRDPEEPETDLEHDEVEPEHSTGGGGGSSQPPAAPEEEHPVPASETPEPEQTEVTEEQVEATDAPTPVLDEELEQARTDVVSTRRKSDNQDAIQAAGGTGGGSGGDGASLPRTGFNLTGAKTQPQIRAIPSELMTALRAQVRSAAIREKGVSPEEAEEFSSRLSLGALVTAFLMAGLDVELDTDAATSVAADLFRSHNPLLGSVLDRMDTLAEYEREQAATLALTRQTLDDVKETAEYVEQALAYSIADRTENFLRGSHDIHQAPITHKEAVFLRDRVREETTKQKRRERDREGRPIR